MGRLAIWRVALELALRNPLTGVGFQATALPHVVAQVDPTVTPRAVHNSYLEAFAEAGGLALACHLVMILAAALDLRRTRRATAGVAGWRWAHDLSGMMQASLLAYCVGSFFISFAFYDGWWYLAALATALRVHACTALAPRGRVAAAGVATAAAAAAARGR
jgi:O-antigen ligase